MKRILAAVMGIMMNVAMVGAPAMAVQIGTTCDPAADKKCNCVTTGLFGEVCDKGDGQAIRDIIKLIVNILTGAVVAAAVIGMAIAGIQYTTSGGNEQQMVKSKNRIVQIAIGLAIWIFMWAALNWLIPGFNGSQAGL